MSGVIRAHLLAVSPGAGGLGMVVIDEVSVFVCVVGCVASGLWCHHCTLVL